MKIAETIVALRKSLGITQEAVANALDVSIDYLMDYARTAEKTVAEHIAHAYEYALIRDDERVKKIIAELG